MICEICGHKYTTSCAHCARRVLTWGVDGTVELLKLAKQSEDIQANELVDFIRKYYAGKATQMSDKANVLRTALKILGFKGKVIGRIHRNKMDYTSIRRREHETGRRWRLLEDHCEQCGGKDNLRLHHILPLSWGGLSSPDNVITLCESCHRKTHKKLTKILNRGLLLELLAPHIDKLTELAKTTVE